MKPLLPERPSVATQEQEQEPVVTTEGSREQLAFTHLTQASCKRKHFTAPTPYAVVPSPSSPSMEDPKKPPKNPTNQTKTNVINIKNKPKRSTKSALDNNFMCIYICIYIHTHTHKHT